jgi:hypothetical protein
MSTQGQTKRIALQNRGKYSREKVEKNGQLWDAISSREQIESIADNAPIMDHKLPGGNQNNQKNLPIAERFISKLLYLN